MLSDVQSLPNSDDLWKTYYQLLFGKVNDQSSRLDAEENMINDYKDTADQHANLLFRTMMVRNCDGILELMRKFQHFDTREINFSKNNDLVRNFIMGYVYNRVAVFEALDVEKTPLVRGVVFENDLKNKVSSYWRGSPKVLPVKTKTERDAFLTDMYKWKDVVDSHSREPGAAILYEVLKDRKLSAKYASNQGFDFF